MPFLGDEARLVTAEARMLFKAHSLMASSAADSCPRSHLRWSPVIVGRDYQSSPPSCSHFLELAFIHLRPCTQICTPMYFHVPAHFVPPFPPQSAQDEK